MQRHSDEPPRYLCSWGEHFLDLQYLPDRMFRFPIHSLEAWCRFVSTREASRVDVAPGPVLCSPEQNLGRVAVLCVQAALPPCPPWALVSPGARAGLP